MKNGLTKILAVAMPIILAFSIQECSNRNAVLPESTEPIDVETSEIIIYEPNDPNNPSNQTQDNNNQETPSESGGETPTTGDDKPASLPSNKGEAINYFNAAIDKSSSLKRVLHARKLTLCNIKPLGDKTNDPKVQELSALNDKTAVAHNLVKLNDGMVSNATAKQEGNNIVLDITLNDISRDSSVKHGDGGYLNIVEFAETESLIIKIADEALGLSGIEIKDPPNYELKSGKYTVTIDSQSGAIKNLKFSAVEGGNGKVKKSIITATVDLSIDLSAEYSA